MDFWQILAIVMTAMTIVAGARWRHFKAVLKEAAEALTVTSDALADDKVTETERSRIAKEWSDVIAAAKKLIGR